MRTCNASPAQCQPTETPGTPADDALALLSAFGVVPLPELWGPLCARIAGRPNLQAQYVADAYLATLGDHLWGRRRP